METMKTKPQNTNTTSGNYIQGSIVHKVILMVALAGVALLLGCGQQALMDAHNEMVALERDYVNAVEQAGKMESDEGVQKACRDFHKGLQNVDVSGCPDDYKKAFNDLTDVAGKISSAAVADDLEEFTRLNQQRLTITKQLNQLGADHGLEMQ